MFHRLLCAIVFASLNAFAAPQFQWKKVNGERVCYDSKDALAPSERCSEVDPTTRYQRRKLIGTDVCMEIDLEKADKVTMEKFPTECTSPVVHKAESPKEPKLVSSFKALYFGHCYKLDMDEAGERHYNDELPVSECTKPKTKYEWQMAMGMNNCFEVDTETGGKKFLDFAHKKCEVVCEETTFESVTNWIKGTLGIVKKSK